MHLENTLFFLVHCHGDDSADLKILVFCHLKIKCCFHTYAHKLVSYWESHMNGASSLRDTAVHGYKFIIWFYIPQFDSETSCDDYVFTHVTASYI